ncbi:cyclic nucleotide-binding domain-containing protein [Streptomyces sp. AJS327]|uniref:Crp/Fnr family transcriptional regulator n=1 Tax=Streptomyces sp. AJS327 TaxID=2545265 RepID=UPI0015DF7209|nr:cyclic nucleotide-binding domain-containing protein [Streptomyces sp. AJS327]MBA0053051.1 cyclic nucleotide-binding domain-containing protein [Streptomyces sp. AJS327]
MASLTGFLDALTPAQRAELRGLGQEVSFAVSTRIFEEGRRADRFWILHTGAVNLEMRVPGRRHVVIDSVRHGELLGWSWLFAPYTWQLSAVAASPVRAVEYPAQPVRELCEQDKELGLALTRAVAGVIGHRLQRSRTRLIDLFGPYSSHGDHPD